ncbi:hypothetical protein Leryth_019838 [Lithospermum erythrorhizon]|uniref:Uncharacterized protein n=1 Tax=Lithospermum erythrorhizon TaxID=34254 RepID=A0AAV3R1Z0_LITER|nr:hypothetical protein Leryth_019838 [Lithospermum erythrorhizon]
MGRDSVSNFVTMPPPPSASVAPLVSNNSMERDEQWRSFDNSVSAVSFGFVATALLISMFLVMAIFERFLRPRSPESGGRNVSNAEAQLRAHGKLECPSPQIPKTTRRKEHHPLSTIAFLNQEKFISVVSLSWNVLYPRFGFMFEKYEMTVYAKGVSVLMPGESMPTFIAHPVPVPCPPERYLQPFHQHIMLPGPSSSSTPRRSPTR